MLFACRYNDAVVWALALLLSLPAFAQQSPPPVSRPEVVAAILQAQRSVVLTASYLRYRDIAEALHRRATQGLYVAVLTSPYTYLDPQSYFLGLHLAGAKIYLGQPTEYILVVDDQPLYRGRGLGATGPITPIPEEERQRVLASVRAMLDNAILFVATPRNIVDHFWRKP